MYTQLQLEEDLKVALVTIVIPSILLLLLVRAFKKAGCL